MPLRTSPPSPGQVRRKGSSESIASIQSEPLSEASSQGLWDVVGPLPLDIAHLPEQPVIIDEVKREAVTTPDRTSSQASLRLKRQRDDDDGDTAQSMGDQCQGGKRKHSDAPNTVPLVECANLEPVVIARFGSITHKILDRARFGVQWEAMRCLNAGSKLPEYYAELHDISQATEVEGIKKLTEYLKRRSSASQHPVGPFMEGDAQECYRESDKEHDQLQEQRSPVYLADSKLGADRWFGGKIHYTIVLKLEKGKGAAFTLERPTLGPSCQLTRRYGSHSIVRLRMPKATFNRGRELQELCLRPFVIGPHVYRAFNCKEHTVRLLLTDETMDRVEKADPTLSVKKCGINFLEFVRNFNDLALNADQTMAKWSTRFNLGLSTSVPGMTIDPTHLHFTTDIISRAHKGPGKPPAELTMTDGCGFANYAFFHELRKQLGWDKVPAAVQIRLHGSKGLVLQHPDHRDFFEDSSDGGRKGEPQVWLRHSQRKIKYPAGVRDPALFTVDVLRAAHLTYPTTLSTETLINLSENGVDSTLVKDLMKTGLEEKVDDLTIWQGQKGICRLHYALNREGGVVAARVAREHPEYARVSGLVFDDPEKDYGDDKVSNDSLTESSIAWQPDPVSGSPSSLEETVMALLESGFTPDNCPVLRDKLKSVAEKSNKAAFSKYRVHIPMSCSAWAVPDPCGVLEAGEIYIQSSAPLLAADGITKVEVILGDVLVTRHPCKVPTDVQKMKAVDRHELHGYRDIVVFSTKGHRVGDQLLDRHPLSMLGGGDYDGDRVEVFWHPGLVSQFRPADPKFATPPVTVEQCLRKNTESVQTFRQRVPETAPYHIQVQEIQRVLLTPLTGASLVGQYSSYWEVAVYMDGYDSPEAIRLAYLFCALLDGTKTGDTVDDRQRKEDQQKYNYRRPQWKMEKVNSNPFAPQTLYRLERSKRLAPFVMDGLQKFLDSVKGALKRKIDERLGAPSLIKVDADLTGPWDDLQKRVKRMQELGQGDRLSQLAEFIMECVSRKREEWRARIQVRNFTGLPIETRQDELRACSRSFHSLVDEIRKAGFFEHSDEELLRYLASYAALHDFETASKQWSRFPWDVAFRTLCEIKARAVSSGDTRTLIRIFYDKMAISRRFLEFSFK